MFFAASKSLRRCLRLLENSYPSRRRQRQTSLSNATPQGWLRQDFGMNSCIDFIFQRYGGAVERRSNAEFEARSASGISTPHICPLPGGGGEADSAAQT